MINKCQFSVLSSYYSIFTDFIHSRRIFIGLYVLENCGIVENSLWFYVSCKADFLNGNSLWTKWTYFVDNKSIKKYEHGQGSTGVI